MTIPLCMNIVMSSCDVDPIPTKLTKKSESTHEQTNKQKSISLKVNQRASHTRMTAQSKRQRERLTDSQH